MCPVISQRERERGCVFPVVFVLGRKEALPARRGLPARKRAKKEDSSGDIVGGQEQSERPGEEAGRRWAWGSRERQGVEEDAGRRRAWRRMQRGAGRGAEQDGGVGSGSSVQAVRMLRTQLRRRIFHSWGAFDRSLVFCSSENITNQPESEERESLYLCYLSTIPSSRKSFARS